MRAGLSRPEIAKDAVQEAALVTVAAVTRVGGAVTTAVTETIGAVGTLGTDLFEIAEAARRAASDRRPPMRVVRDPEPESVAGSVSRAG